MTSREKAEHIFLAGIKGVLPGKLMSDLISLNGDQLRIGDHIFNLSLFGNIYVIGAGKASAAMGHYLETILGKRIAGGHIVTRYGCYVRLKNIDVTEAGHPVPDKNSFRAGSIVKEIATRTSDTDLFICLWSGGGSSLMADHPENSSPSELMFLNEMLVRCGADISEINIIRKHLSGIKGGQLSRLIWPATCINILLSDVPGDKPEVIASGPTVPDNSTFSDALGIVRKYGLENDIPQALLNHLINGTSGFVVDTPKTGDIIFSKTHTQLAGNNKTALKAAGIESEKLGYRTQIEERNLTGTTTDACLYIIEKINEYQIEKPVTVPVCILFGGETTVKVTGSGDGGRNQHLALELAIAIKDMPGVTILAGGTDGSDGNTDMTGAVADAETILKAVTLNLDPRFYLNECDSFNFFRRSGGHIHTGPTLTNVMDIVVVLIE